MKHKDDWKKQWEAMEDAGEAPDIADFVADIQLDAIENPPEGVVSPAPKPPTFGDQLRRELANPDSMLAGIKSKWSAWKYFVKTQPKRYKIIQSAGWFYLTDNGFTVDDSATMPVSFYLQISNLAKSS